MSDIALRHARGSKAQSAAETYQRLASAPGATPSLLRPAPASNARWVTAVQGERIVGVAGWLPGEGRCAALLEPHLAQWDEQAAAQLLAESARGAAAEGARLIQAVTEPEGQSALGRALQAAGLERLAVLAYLRRRITTADVHGEAPATLEFRRWTPWRRGRFARVIERSYEGSLDCPAMAGLRTARDAIATHRATGVFRPGAWHLAMEGRKAVGVVLTNAVEGRGDITYLGVVPEARRRGIGRALLEQAIRDTARMGLPTLCLAVDTANEPAVRLYAGAGFEEVRRRLTWFVPKERIESPGFAALTPGR